MDQKSTSETRQGVSGGTWQDSVRRALECHEQFDYLKVLHISIPIGFNKRRMKMQYIDEKRMNERYYQPMTAFVRMQKGRRVFGIQQRLPISIDGDTLNRKSSFVYIIDDDKVIISRFLGTRNSEAIKTQAEKLAKECDQFVFVYGDDDNLHHAMPKSSDNQESDSLLF